jgi:hypothetical protein
VAAPAKPSIVQRLPFPESVQSAQKNKAVGKIQSNRRRHFHQRTLWERAWQYNRTASRKADRKNPYFEVWLVDLYFTSSNSATPVFPRPRVNLFAFAELPCP